MQEYAKGTPGMQTKQKKLPDIEFLWRYMQCPQLITDLLDSISSRALGYSTN